MISTDDIVDIISRLSQKNSSARHSSARYGFFSRPEEPYIRSFSVLRGGRKFFSEYDLRQSLQRGEKTIRLTRGTIISPLAQEIIDEKGIEIVWE